MSVFSAPGKAMMAGGYLVLDPQYKSYVTVLSSRMHAKILTDKTDSSKSSISVKSPQFGGSWLYTVDHHDGWCEITSEGSRNPFLEAAVRTVLNYVVPEKAASYEITLFSDPGYHAQDGAQPHRSANGKKQFLYHGKPIEQVPKTGLGSSAGLVTVVSTALLTTMLKCAPGEILDKIHNVAQIAHCDAQGKIGSGFDVAAAVYGSIVYRRFPPESINHLLGCKPGPSFPAQLRKSVDSEWDFVHTRCSLPPGVKLLMGDVNGGSETPKLVSQVLAWRKSHPDSGSVYAQLDEANLQFMQELESLHQRHQESPESYMEALDNGALLAGLKTAVAAIRAGLQKLTASSGAAIEPREQTELLDRCAGLPGCVGGVVPGAGGYDAICLLVEEKRVSELKLSTAKTAGFEAVTWLDLAEEAAGVVAECASDYDGLPQI